MNARTITLTAIPGWDSTPYNLITDTDVPLSTASGVITVPATPASVGSSQNPDGYGFPAIWFTSNLAWLGSSRPGGDDPAADAAAIMNFNQFGVMSGPATNPAGGAPNPGGIITATLVQIEPQPNGTIYVNPTVSASINLTNALPGQMYWSAPLAHNFQVYGTLYTGQTGLLNQQLYYYIALLSSVNYVMYTHRSCVMRNGKAWGSRAGWPAQPGLPPNITSDHDYTLGADLNLVNYQNLGAAPLAPNIALAGTVLRRGELGTPPAELIPQFSLAGKLHRAGTFEGSNNLMIGTPILANPGGLVGGSLWKPAKLCSG
jgi:hypothetical protein